MLQHTAFPWNMISDLEKGSNNNIKKNGFGSQHRVTDLAASADDFKKTQAEFLNL